MTMTLEQLLTARAGFGLTTATPVQRAVCRVIEGRPLGELTDDPEVQQALGGEAAIAKLGRKKPKEVLLLAGIRSGKSLIAAALALHATQTCTMPKGKGETPRVSVVSLKLDLADVVYNHIVGNVMAQPALRALLVEPPTADTITLRHPSGKPVEIKTVAGARAGASLVSRWSAGVIFDEAPRMIGADDGVVNLDDERHSVLGRLLDGAQVISIGSPWAPFGPVYKLVQEHFSKPTRSMVVIRATGPMMNPIHWTPERIADLKEHDAIAYRTDVLGEFADPESSMFASEELQKATRKTPVELSPQPRAHYSAAMDPATRNNAWTLVIVQRDGDRRLVACARQWKAPRGGRLDPDATMKEIAAVCEQYGIRRIRSDNWSGDSIAAIAQHQAHKVAIDIITMQTPERVAAYQSVRTLIDRGLLELAPVEQLIGDLVSVRKRVTQTGLTIELPQTSDGRHADYAPSLVLALNGIEEAPTRILLPSNLRRDRCSSLAEREAMLASESEVKRNYRLLRGDRWGGSRGF